MFRRTLRRIRLPCFILTHSKAHLPAGDLGQAIPYTLNPCSKLLVFLESGSLELDTDLGAKMIRPTTLGIKNWILLGSLEAVENNTMIYSLPANCRA